MMQTLPRSPRSSPRGESADSLPPDLVLYNGRVLTLDRVGRRAEAVAVRDGLVLATGTSREMLALAAPGTERRDLAGRVVTPGFLETHTHPLWVGMVASAPVDASSPSNDSVADILERVAAAARERQPGQWVLGAGYDHTRLRERRHPTRTELDRAAPDNPVAILHASTHQGVCNSAALRLAGIGRDTPPPPDGVVGRDPDGEPNGLLAEAAVLQVAEALPPVTPDLLDACLAAAGAEYLRHGITTVHDLGVGLVAGAAELDAYARVCGTGRFGPSVRGFLRHEVIDEFDAVERGPVAFARTEGPGGFEVGGVKLVADGALQGLTACLRDAYECDPDAHGLMSMTPGELRRAVARYTAAGWQIATHGNGDAAIDAVLDAYRHAGDARAPRHRIEHCQTIREDQLDLLAEHGVLASVFVKHVHYWGDQHHDRWLGPRRAGRISPLASLRRRSIRFGLHSDSPVTPVSPLEAMWCATARRTRSGRVLGPEQRVGVEDALRAYTSEAAWLGHAETTHGTVEPGKVADLTVLDTDPTTAEPDALREVRVEATVVGGVVRYERAIGGPAS
ncbi:amidohydrolase [Streptomyces sp. LE64]|uniref:amidohydrolase n=1 Tax=Streptomyces sp. LE64 TaxID=3448653 RepID=UPI004042B4ED